MIKNLSFWEQEFFFYDVDIFIIGAGIVGLTSAYFLKKKFPDKKIVVLERQFPGYGASTKNAGFACIGSPSEILSDVVQNGEQHAIELIKMRWSGLQLLKSIVSPDSMRFKNLGAKELFFNSEKQDVVIDQLDYLNQLMEAAIAKDHFFRITKNRETKGLSHQAVEWDLESQLNPVLIINELQKKVRSLGVQVVYGANVSQIIPKKIKLILSDSLELEAKKIVVCNNGFAKDLMSLEDLKTVRNQVLMTKPLKGLQISGNYHLDEGYIYFRSYNNRLLIGGARNLDVERETTSKFGRNQQINDYLKSFVSTHLYAADDLEYESQWSGILGVGSSKKPIVQEINKNIYVAVRLGGMGVAIGSYVGNKVAEMITA